MSVDRLTRVNQLLKQEIAGSLFRILNDPGTDLSTLTVTRVETSSDLRKARVYVSVLGDDHTRNELMNRLRQHRKDIQREVSRHVVLKYTPHLSFHSDDSIAEGDRVLHLIDDLEAEHPEWKDRSDADEQTDTR